MPSQTPTSESESYLFVVNDGQDGPAPDTVFFWAGDAELAASICRLCEREYGGPLKFNHRQSSAISLDEQVLLDEAIDDLNIYDDPDPGIYDPQPTRQTLLRAELLRRCRRWKDMLRSRRETAGAPAQLAAQHRGTGCSMAAECRLTDDELLKICGIFKDDPELTPELIADLRQVTCLIGQRDVGTGASLELSLSLLASVLGSFPRHNPTDLPFGYQEPAIKSHGWLDRDTLERTGKQIVGLLWDDCTPDTVALRVEQAISEAVRLGFIAKQQYDAWRPGMPSGSGWRCAVSATTYGLTRASASIGEAERVNGDRNPSASAMPQANQQPDAASNETTTTDAEETPTPEERRVSALVLLMLLAQAYYTLLESTISVAGWCTALDLPLNESYLWVTSNLAKLLSNHESLSDFPVPFEPLFPDLYPSTIGDHDWEDMVAPHAEGFLSAVQKYVHEKGIYDPAERSSAWIIVQLFRPAIDTAIERASSYNKRMRDYIRKAFGDDHNSASGRVNATLNRQSEHQPGAAQSPHADTGSTSKDGAPCVDKSSTRGSPVRPEAVKHPSKRVDGPAVQLGRPGEACTVLGKQKRPLTDGQYAVVGELLRAGEEGLTKDALEAVRASARSILKRLRKDPDWSEVILMPGQTNGRYRIRA